MRIFRRGADVPPDFGPSAITIGNFDGVHLGHQRILRRVTELAAEHGWKPSVLTFDPHPTRVVAPERAPRLMTTIDERAELMSRAGIEQILILPFDRAVSQLDAGEFVRQILVDKLQARAVLVGDNFRFGRGQSGNVSVLKGLGTEYGFEVEIVPAVTCRGQVVSSSGVRDLLAQGRVALAARFLGRPYELAGDVVSGRGVGSKQTVPTLNLATNTEMIPARGVYVTHTRELDGAGRWRSVTNIGYRPTFGDSHQLSIETFLLDPLAGETPRRIAVDFLWRIREERRFSSPEALKARILADAAAAARYHRRAAGWVRRS